MKWDPPPPGWHKLNIDGAFHKNPGMAGIGGVIRDDNGEFVPAFAKNIGSASNNQAELWVLKQSLQMVIDIKLS